MAVRTTVRLPEELLMRAKLKAASQGRTLTALIEEGLRLAISEPRKGLSRKRTLPRISKASGGLAPGVDLTRFSELQEQDDLEYAKKTGRRGFE